MKKLDGNGDERNVWQHVRFNTENIDTIDVPAYSTIYGRHPSSFVTVGPLYFGSPELLPHKLLSDRADASTGKIVAIAQARKRCLVNVDPDKRRDVLRSTLLDGATVEEPTANVVERVFAVTKKKKLGPKGWEQNV